MRKANQELLEMHEVGGLPRPGDMRFGGPGAAFGTRAVAAGNAQFTGGMERREGNGSFGHRF